MATQINIEYQNKNYTLEYSRATAEQAEQSGFVLDQVSRMPLTMIPKLFYYAFAKHHRGIKRSEVDSIYTNLKKKVGEEGEESLIGVLTEMYAEAMTTLVTDEGIDEGNAASWTVVKG